jgi:hypothetical protein
MVLRELFKCNTANDGSRSLVESILVPEVAKAIHDWKRSAGKIGVLIGGLALSFYVKPRHTTDGDFLFLAADDIPSQVPGFKRTRPGAFLHKETHVEIEVLVPQAINMTKELAQKIADTAVEKDGYKIASREGLVAAKLQRFKLQDRADINALLLLGPIDLSRFPLSDKQLANLSTALETIEGE